MEEAYYTFNDTSSTLPDEFGVDGDNSSSLLNNETTSGSSSVEMYCGPTVAWFGTGYKNMHGYTSLLVCFFGILANLLNLIVLTRKGMISATNAILTGLALADLLNMIEYVPYAIHSYILGPSKEWKTYGWALFVLVHSNFSQVCHTISIWLTVTLAVWRYIMVAMPMKNKTLCTMERAKWAIVSAYFFSLILCTPVYLSFSIKEMNNTTPNATSPIYIVYYSTLAQASDELLVRSNFWIYSVVIKLIPCIALTVVSLRLINSLMEAKKRKDKLLSKRNTAGGAAGTDNNNESGSDRTTRMLLAILLLFLITEFPQGILGLLSGLLGMPFFKSCYMPLGELMDFFALLNSAINFILYCAMSKKFRETFSQVFQLDRLCASKGAEPVHNAPSTVQTQSTTV